MSKNIPDSLYIMPDNKKLFEVFDYEGCDIDWSSVRLLDLGCNQGNYLWHSSITPENYVGVDIVEKFVDIARYIHPEYTFAHCNKWHPSYNPTGSKTASLKDVVTGQFDVVIAYSVFSHSTVSQIHKEIDDVLSVLKPGGTFLFTSTLISDYPMFFSFWSKRTNETHTLPMTVNDSEIFYAVDLDRVIKDQDEIDVDSCESLVSFYSASKIESLFSAKRVPSSYQALFRIDKPL